MVVIDTNILDNMPLLQDPKSVALLFFLRQREAVLGLPKIIKDEWRGHFVENCEKKAKEIRRQAKWLSSTLGFRQLQGYETAAGRAGQAFDRRLQDLKDVVQDLPIAASHWREAGEMVIAGSPPSKPGSQQYKDSLIWRALMDAAQSQQVVFVSKDNGFIDKATGKLAPELRQEVDAAEADLWITSDLVEVLDLLQPDSYDLADSLSEFIADVKDQYVDQLNERIRADDWMVSPQPAAEWSLETFATENPDELVVTIDAGHDLVRIHDPEMDVPASATSSGSALVKIASGDIVMDLGEITLTIVGIHSNAVRTYEVQVATLPDPRAVRVRLDIPEL